MTEGGGSCILDAHLIRTSCTPSASPPPGHDIRLIDEQGAKCRTARVGEVVGRSAAMMTDYHNQPAKTAEAEWHDADGLPLHPHRRRRPLRRRRLPDPDGPPQGHGHLAAASTSTRATSKLCCASIPRWPSGGGRRAVASEWGETPVAFVVRHAGHDEGPTRSRAGQRRVGKTQRLAALRLIDELPRSAIGKVLKRELRDGYRALDQ